MYFDASFMFDLSVFKEIGYVTKMATVPILGKNSSKIFFLEFKGPITLGLGVYHYNVCSWVKTAKFDQTKILG